MKKPVALIIMDGFGYSENAEGNAVAKAQTPNLCRLTKEYPNTLIKASGLDVGLPYLQMGNSEVGHTNIGAGRIVYQDLTRITKSIKDGDFFTNEVLSNVMDGSKGHALHIMGLLSDGGVHSHIEHVEALILMAKKRGVEKLYIHAFTDGRDTDPQSAIEFIKEIECTLKDVDLGQFATVSGRYYAMDRDKRWDRVKLAYNAMVDGVGETASSAEEAVKNSYDQGKNDEFIIPTVIQKNGEPVGKISDGDSIVFFNFRPDRARQMTRAIVVKKFEDFDRKYINTNFVCLTEYDSTIENVQVAFNPQSLKNTLGEYLAENGKTQLRAAETEKYAHVTFFFNGGVEEPNYGEERMLIPSPKVATYDLQPEMSAHELLNKTIAKVDEDKFDFIVINFANPDMVGHTGSIEATVKAVETVDNCVGSLVDKIVSVGGSAIITADHGNAEYMIDHETKKMVTSHSTNEVPFILVGEKYKGAKLLNDGRLSDIAPTVLDMMDLSKPEEMDGHTLIEK
ncbi:2,3-bisphosphoglycerate-independent phosphoglycerate mutase [Clostridioides mangenotii]|uniref:2,3-bisphosphoglycerate-independent phosphoglycerate mutase n=1 Tax=Metaclostridioides mangenotii TaxID=1540 RepID=UPI00214A0C80|nr:2,3-bisphosphoglycerate-independent phosphoglycerate mutase [Clostridioides mangenotii]MCR1955798.1 2,3-bisphosphoglycerate-independent phosphoglycerate mutase [Clostridioides mangenotii]